MEERVRTIVENDIAGTLIHKAMLHKRNCLELVTDCLLHGLNPDSKNKLGETVLHKAIANRQPKVVSVLLQNNADVNATNTVGDSPLHQAFISALDMNIVNELCNAGATFRSVNNKGDTPLHVAIKNKLCNAPVIQSIMKRDAQINSQNKQGRTALVEAAFRSKDPSIIKALLENGANVNILDCRGYNALHYAISYKDMNTARLLFKYRTNPCSQNLQCCFGDENSIFLLMQFLTLQHFEHNKESLSQEHIWNKIAVDLKPSIYFKFDELKKMFTTCFLELDSMKSVFIQNNFTVYNFVLDNIFFNRFQTEEPDYIIERVAIASRRNAGRYKNYLNLIISYFNRRKLLCCLSNQVISHTLPCGRVVNLNADSLLSMSTYLSNQDLQNLVIACLS